jgi:RNA polymerase sigma factor (sigma-70 family)
MIDRPDPNRNHADNGDNGTDAAFAAFLAGGPLSNAAFTKLCCICLPQFLGRLRSFGHTQADGQDICQRVFVRLWRSRDRITIRTTARAYLATCLRNERVTWIREQSGRRKREVSGVENPESIAADHGLAGYASSPEEELELENQEVDRLQLTDCLSKAFQEFGLRFPERAFVVERQELDGWSIDEIAEVIGRTYAATKQFLSTSRKSLRDFASQRCPQELANA